MILKNRGEELTKQDLEEISQNFRCSRHAKEQLERRLINGERVSIRKLLKDPLLAYFNTDQSINVALDKFHYAVIVYSEREGFFKVVTWKEDSWNGIDIYKKQELAKQGISR